MMWRVMFALFLLAMPAKAQDTAPFLLRVAVSPEGPVWVGQRIDVTLTATTPVRFVSPPSWPELVTTRGRIIVLPEASTVPGTERVNGQSYAALQRTYAAFVAEAGTVVIAPIGMSVRVGGPDGGPVEAQASTAESRITARLPPGVNDVTRLVVAPSFRMSAAVEGQARQVHVGEAVIRTLRMEADDTTAMLLPTGAWGRPEGVRVYPDPPVLQDRSDRGVFHALRTERVAFVPQHPGTVELPGFSVTWFEPRGGRSTEVKVEALRLEVLPSPHAGGVATEGAHPVGWLLAACLAALAMPGGVLAWWWLRHRRRAPVAIAPLVEACRAGDAKAALRALYRWSDAVLPSGGERTIASLAGRTQVPELAVQANALEARVFGDGASEWNGAALVQSARQAERALRLVAPVRHRRALPMLNPTIASRTASDRAALGAMTMEGTER